MPANNDVNYRPKGQVHRDQGQDFVLHAASVSIIR